MADFELRGSQDLARLAARLKSAGARDLRNELLRGVRGSAKKAIPDIESSARTILPHAGGLNELVASQKIVVRTSTATSGARVRLQGMGMKELWVINSGRVRHPTYGNRKVWKSQKITPGFFSDPVAHRAPEIRMDIQRVIYSVNRKIAARSFL